MTPLAPEATPRVPGAGSPSRDAAETERACRQPKQDTRSGTYSRNGRRAGAP